MCGRSNSSTLRWGALGVTPQRDIWVQLATTVNGKELDRMFLDQGMYLSLPRPKISAIFIHYSPTPWDKVSRSNACANTAEHIIP